MMPLYPFEQPYTPQESSFVFGQDCIGLEMAAMVAYGNPLSAAWGSANQALFFPITIQTPAIAYQLWLWNGGTVSGNFDIGLYDENGTRLVSSGATAQSGITSIQLVDIADTVLPAGTTWLAIVLNNTTGTTLRINPGAAYIAPLGVYQQNSAYPLPATATYARLGGGSTAAVNVPMCGILFRSSI